MRLPMHYLRLLSADSKTFSAPNFGPLSSSPYSTPLLTCIIDELQLEFYQKAFLSGVCARVCTQVSHHPRPVASQTVASMYSRTIVLTRCNSIVIVRADKLLNEVEFYTALEVYLANHAV